MIFRPTFVELDEILLGNNRWAVDHLAVWIFGYKHTL